jgi:hypothetical protein
VEFKSNGKEWEPRSGVKGFNGRFAWTVTGPPSGKARLRISWTDDLSVSDQSDTTFRIKLEG